MLRSVGWTSGYILKEDWVGIKEVRIAQGNGKTVITVSHIAEAFGQTFSYGERNETEMIQVQGFIEISIRCAIACATLEQEILVCLFIRLSTKRFRRLTVTAEAFILLVVNSIIESVLLELIPNCIESLNGVNRAAHAFLLMETKID